MSQRMESCAVCFHPDVSRITFGVKHCSACKIFEEDGQNGLKVLMGQSLVGEKKVLLRDIKKEKRWEPND